METLYDDATAKPSADIEDIPELDRFTPYIGEKFDVALPHGSLQIELVEAKALPEYTGGQSNGAFSLVFRAPNDCTLAQGSVALDHEKAGWVIVFLVPIGEDEDGQYFEAVFN